MKTLEQQRLASIEATRNGPPQRTTNQFFGVGPITDMVRDEIDAKKLRFSFDAWLENNYPKMNDLGEPIGKFTASELGRSMHRGYPADKVLVDMMQQIHSYFGFPKSNMMAVGLGGGHSGFTVCALHLCNTNADQRIFVDTPKPESEAAASSGFFRQSWAAQLIEMQRYARNGDESRIHFSESEGHIPSASELVDMGITVFFGVGHETTGATTYTEKEIQNLLDWVAINPKKHHVVIDSTSLLGSMPWSKDIVEQVMIRCCLFTPFQKAIGGISGYFLISLTKQAIDLIETNVQSPCWSIPRQLKIAVPLNAKKPLSGNISTSLGPLYNPATNTMQGGIINTFSTLAFAETNFGLQRIEQTIGDVATLNARSLANRQIVDDWIAKNPLFTLAVSASESRGTAVTLIQVNDTDIADADLRATIIAKSKQLLGYEGITHPNGEYELGLDVARYIHAFPGTSGDYRAWISGIRPQSDIIALLDNIAYAYHRAKIATLEELLAKDGIYFPAQPKDDAPVRQDDTNRAYCVLIADLVGLRFDDNNQPDYREVQHHIEKKGSLFHVGSIKDTNKLATGKIHFFYQPDISTEAELFAHSGDGQYDAIIAAATVIPDSTKFAIAGVRIGAGTGNMISSSWGGANGVGGKAALMNTPSFNSRATAQMVMKALLKVMPDLPVGELHQRVVAGDFDTGKNLWQYPTEKLEGKRIAILGYGNIGRQLALLAQAFGLQVVIYARPHYKKWIESEGFTFATSAQEAASGADILSPHTGLGTVNNNGVFTNAGLINTNVLNALNDGAVIINYDRGEIIDSAALDNALTCDKVRYVAVDADIFDTGEGKLSGPMVPYRELAIKHQGKMELLPHVAADTEHLSRVEGAKQAVDQIHDAIQYKRITNRVGQLPKGYSDNGSYTVANVGKANPQRIAEAIQNEHCLNELRAISEHLTAFWGAVSATHDKSSLHDLIDRYGEELILNSNRYSQYMNKLGLRGIYSSN